MYHNDHHKHEMVTFRIRQEEAGPLVTPEVTMLATDTEGPSARRVRSDPMTIDRTTLIPGRVLDSSLILEALPPSGTQSVLDGPPNVGDREDLIEAAFDPAAGAPAAQGMDLPNSASHPIGPLSTCALQAVGDVASPGGCREAGGSVTEANALPSGPSRSSRELIEAGLRCDSMISYI